MYEKGFKNNFKLAFRFNNNFRFDGRVVAQLPFVPVSWIQGLSHRNLAGTDYTECSFIFLYILCTMSIRQVRSNYVHINSRVTNFYKK